jgi:hypothetical protein
MQELGLFCFSIHSFLLNKIGKHLLIQTEDTRLEKHQARRERERTSTQRKQGNSIRTRFKPVSFLVISALLAFLIVLDKNILSWCLVFSVRVTMKQDEQFPQQTDDKSKLNQHSAQAK